MRRAMAAAAVAVTLFLVAAACGGPRNSLNTATGICYRALGVAGNAVHHKGRFLGVRRAKARNVAKYMPAAATIREDEVCVVGFQGEFRPGDVTDANPPGPGRYAVIAVTRGDPHLIGARVVDDLPLSFRRHLGL